MVSTKVFAFYLFFIIFFSFIYTGFTLSESGFDINNFFIVKNLRNKIDSGEAKEWVKSILNVVLIPFLLLDVLIGIIALVSFTFTSMPMILSTLILTPLGIIITLDYVLPYIRGN